MEDPGYPFDPRTGPYRNGLLSGGPTPGGLLGAVMSQPGILQQMANPPTLAQIRDGSADISAPMGLMMGMTSPFVRVWRGSPRAAAENFGLPPPNSPEPVVWFTSDRGQAEQFARMRNGLRREWSPDLYMYEAQLPRDQIQSFPWRNFAPDDPLYMPRNMRGLLSAARQEGAAIARIPGIQNFENGPLTTSYAVFDPSLVRILGRERFDP